MTRTTRSFIATPSPGHRATLRWQRWISDYHFDKALEHRFQNDAASGHAVGDITAKHLLLWGRVSPSGDLKLDPAFVLDGASDPPMALVTDRTTGRITAILRGEDAVRDAVASPGTAVGSASATDILVSYGLPRSKPK